MKIYYVVTMYREGNLNKHSYVLGVFDTIKKAETGGGIEEVYRGGNKYKLDITVHKLNDIDNSIMKEVWEIQTLIRNKE